MAKLSPVFNDQTFDVNGDPAVGYQLFTYEAGSSTKKTTYSDDAGTIPNQNPIIINSLGYPSQGPIWLQEGSGYKFVLALPTDTDPPTSPVKTIDDVTGVGDNTVSVSQWISSGVTPTYINATTFTLPGDQTTAFQPGRREQFTVSAGTVYGNILTSVFTTLTTVTMQMDAGQALDAGLSVVNHSILLASPSAEPSIKTQSFTMGSSYGNFSILTAKGATVSAAATTSVFAATDGNVVDIAITGTTITSFGVSERAGYVVEGTFTGTGTQPLTQSTNLNLGGVSVVAYPGWKYRAVANTTSQIDVTITPNFQNLPTIPQISATVNTPANGVTLTLQPMYLDFRSSPLTSGTANRRLIPAAISTVISSGSTGGTVNAIASRIVLLAIDNAGTVELAWTNIAGGLNLDETTLINTVAEGGAGAADSANVIYSTTARTGVPFRVVGFFDSTQATAGTWVTTPTLIQGAAGQALASLSSLGYGQTYQSVTRTVGTTYYNTTGKPILLTLSIGASAGATLSFTVNGVTGVNPTSYGGSASMGLSSSVIIPPGASYSSTGNTATATAFELR